LTIYLQSDPGIAASPATGCARPLAADRTLDWALFASFYLLLAVIAAAQGGPPDLGIMLAP
jgi:hypothetical protein